MADALAELASYEKSDPEVLIAELMQVETDIHKKFKQEPLPLLSQSLYTVGKGQERDPSIDVDLYYKGKSICRTARTPAQSRYLGYTTNSNKTGNFAVLGTEQYDTGIPLNKVDGAAAVDGSMPLVYEPGGRERERCAVVLKPDYKDFFYTHSRHGKTKLTFPNEKEKHAYGYNHSEFKGVFNMWFVMCDWGKCKNGDMRPEHFAEGKFSLFINGKPVVELVAAGFENWVLKGEHGIQWEPNGSGEFELQAEVLESGSFLRISSIALF